MDSIYSLKRRLHSLMHRHFGFDNELESHKWLQREVGKSHVSELTTAELYEAIDKIPKSSMVREKTWDIIKRRKND